MSKYVCMTSNQFAEATAVKPPFRKSNTVHFMLKGQLLVIARETTPLPHKSTDIPDRPTKLKIRGKISIIHTLHFVAAICWETAMLFLAWGAAAAWSSGTPAAWSSGTPRARCIQLLDAAERPAERPRFKVCTYGGEGECSAGLGVRKTCNENPRNIRK